MGEPRAIPHTMMLLAESEDSLALVISIAGLIFATLLLFGIFTWLRKRMLGDAGDDDGQTLSVNQVRQLHREGRISDAEFEALKKAALLAAGVPADKVRGDSPSSESGDAKSQHAGAPERTPDGGLRARPGYDLTGEPLPGNDDQWPPSPPSNR